MNSVKNKITILSVMIIASIFLSACQTTKDEKTPSKKLHTSSAYYTPQTKNVAGKCFPQSLLNILAYIKQQTGVTPILTSGHRPGARKKSMHRPCKAADIRVPGVSDAKVIRIARNAPGIGGIGTYCNGIIHVDVGSRREWRYC